MYDFNRELYLNGASYGAALSRGYGVRAAMRELRENEANAAPLSFVAGMTDALLDVVQSEGATAL
jgi:hypothetical protein